MKVVGLEAQLAQMESNHTESLGHRAAELDQLKLEYERLCQKHEGLEKEREEMDESVAQVAQREDQLLEAIGRTHADRPRSGACEREHHARARAEEPGVAKNQSRCGSGCTNRPEHGERYAYARGHLRVRLPD